MIICVKNLYGKKFLINKFFFVGKQCQLSDVSLSALTLGLEAKKKDLWCKGD